MIVPLQRYYSLKQIKSHRLIGFMYKRIMAYNEWLLHEKRSIGIKIHGQRLQAITQHLV